MHISYRKLGVSVIYVVVMILIESYFNSYFIQQVQELNCEAF